jgi:tetratricopeptide (TPR) repeat protein
VSVALIAAAAVFAASLGLAVAFARRGREPIAFAALVGSPVAAALGYLAAAMLARPVVPERPPVAPPAAPVATTPAEAMRREAEDLRRDKRFAEARDAYAKLVAAAPDDADGWADLADAQAAATDGDLRAGGAAIDRALAIDPNHPKALWLKASLELQERRYASAAQLWERLLAQLPPDSNDARIVRANLDEARALASRPGATR